jgi:hypothetical protein
MILRELSRHLRRYSVKKDDSQTPNTHHHINTP